MNVTETIFSGKRGLLITFLVTAISVALNAQSYSFRTYSVEQGLPDRFVYTLQSDPNGYLWIGTGAGLSRFDGHRFYSDMLPDSLEKSSVTAGFTDFSGKIWFGFNDGHVLRFSGMGAPRYYNIREYSRSSIKAFGEDPYGDVLIASQNGGIFRISQGDDQAIEHLDLDINGITSIVADSTGKLLVGSFEGLFVYNLSSATGSPTLIKTVKELEGTQIQSICKGKSGDTYFAATRDEGLYVIHFTDQHITKVTNLSEQLHLPEINPQQVMVDQKGNIWLPTFGDGVIRINNISKTPEVVIYNQRNGLESKNIKVVFEDFEHNIWFGTYGEGLTRLQDEAFRFIHFNDPPGDNVLSLTIKDNLLITGMNAGIVIHDNATGEERFLGSSQGIPADEMISMYDDNENGRIWIGTAQNGVYSLDKPYRKADPFFVSANDLERRINDIVVDGDKIWVATSNGVFILGPAGKVLNHFTTYEGLPYNKINEIYLDDDGTAWIATTSDALYTITPSGEVKRTLVIPNMSGRNEFLTVMRDRDGDIWAGTYGFGLYYFTPDTILNYSTVSGLLSNYCYSLIQDNQGDIWIGHHSGISRLDKNTHFIRTYTAKDGLAGDVNSGASVMDQSNGSLWFGTTSGVVTYNANNELPTNIPPKTSLISIVFSDQSYPVSKKLILPYGKYRLRIDFIGISYAHPDAVRYQYILENYDSEWSALTSGTNAYYSRIEDGHYRFMLKAYNAFGISNPESLTVQIIIKKPFWKTWWFYLLSMLIFVGGVVVIIKVRERNHIKRQKYLEEELDKRTHEVVAQKEELEVKNKEITDSINYAKRIQASILPPVQRLKDVFPESFVFYQPRDIVSGDFYWWGKIDEDRFLVVCADSTGHGVPGAFMSMIGSTLIKDVTNQHRYQSPSQLLAYLDKEITSALNQNLETERSNDGMDIIICEINPVARHLKFASAMRPIILLHQNEQFYIRGNRSAVGGEVLGEKNFDDLEYDLNKGDILYMFSDGYPDQFGGPRGKKFKMVRLKNLIDDIREKNMDEQWLQIKTNFDTWKGKHDQVDDVLFMGIRLL